MEDQLLYTVAEAAKRLAVGRTTLYLLIARGDIRAVHIGRATRITATELAKFADQLTRAT